MVDANGEAVSKEDLLKREFGLDSDDEALADAEEDDHVPKEKFDALKNALKEVVRSKKAADAARVEAGERTERYKEKLEQTERLCRAQVASVRRNHEETVKRQMVLVGELKDACRHGDVAVVSNIVEVHLKELDDAPGAAAEKDEASVSALQEIVDENEAMRRKVDELKAKLQRARERVAEGELMDEDETAGDGDEAEEDFASKMERVSKDNGRLKSLLAASEERQDLLADQCDALRASLDTAASVLTPEQRAVVEQQHGELEAQLAKATEACNSQHAANEKRLAQATRMGGMDIGGQVQRVNEELKLFMSDFSALEEAVIAFQSGLGPAIESMVVPLVQSHEKQLEHILVKYKKEMSLRKRLFNQVQELRGNIRVYCRSRPLTPSEVKKGMELATTFPEEGEIAVTDSRGVVKQFEFDKIFGPGCSQEFIFEDTQPLVTSCIDGYNVCIFAYGQTGAGKTYTMEGPPHDKGVNYRALMELFRVTQERGSDGWKYEISVRFLEIYNEVIRDLLQSVDEQAGQKFQIRNGADGTYVEGLTEFAVCSIEDVVQLMKAGSANRSVAGTKLNVDSSRSHSVLQIGVAGKNSMTGHTSRGKLTLVDLAGSERVGKSEVTGDRLKEAQNINRSLSALGTVMASLQANQSHVPYRDSKLTHLLQDSLGGDSKTLMFCHINPTTVNISESICTLNFAARVRNVVIGPATKNSGAKKGQGKR